MKGNKGRIRGKKVLSMLLAVTLSMSPVASMGSVEAEEVQNPKILNGGEETENPNVLSVMEDTENADVSTIDEETGDIDALEESEEIVEDKEYVVYIEMSDEIQSTADEDNGNTISENADTAGHSDNGNADTVGQPASENTLSEMTVSENVMSKEAVITNEDKITESGAIGNESAKTAEDIQESIEEAEELILNQAEGQELVKDEETIIYAADLTQKEIKELKESEATIYVEENIELFGADSKRKTEEPDKKKTDKASKKAIIAKTNDKKSQTQKSAEKKQDKKKSNEKNQKDSGIENQKSSDIKEKKLAYKKSLSKTQDEEQEWNIRMINADESAIENTDATEITDVSEKADGNEKSNEDEVVAGEVAHNQVVQSKTEEGTCHPVKIAVMDSGIELLSGIPVQEIVNLVPDEQYLPYYMNDMTGHGTAVAGIINDIAPNAEIYSVKIMDGENKATLTRVVEGIYWCIENDIDIINMSFGTQTESQVLEKAIEDAHKAGILIVSSAGNGGRSGVEYPAAYEEVIAVGAVDTTAQKTEESAVGEEVELVAPGEEIISDSMLGLETVVSGTSMAAPHVTAAAAVLWQKDKSKSPSFIRGLLAQSANDLGNEDEYGNGLVDLEYALEHYEEYTVAYEESIVEGEQELLEINLEADLEEKEATISENTVITSETDLEEKLDARTQEQIIKENITPIETFEDVDYVEGRWGKSNHELLVKKANDELDGCLDLNELELKIFKKGAVYPDQELQVSKKSSNRNWHGGCGVNYVANYRFATRMAKYGGDITKYKQMKGQSIECYNQMSIQINEQRAGSRFYEDILNVNMNNLQFCYADLNAAGKKRWRQIFLYGIAAHIATDTFAHSAYKKDGKVYIKLTHDDGAADNINVCKKRFIDAQEAMCMVLLNCDSLEIGSELDFSPKEELWGIKRGYYLMKILKYASDTAEYFTHSELKEMYGAINYEP